jgi:predicted TIM-barrel fold metal-dependent hydrolase
VSVMGGMSRRAWLAGLGAGLAGTNVRIGRAEGAVPTALLQEGEAGLPLTEFQPRSMLHVSESHVDRARYPLIDIHTHLTSRARSVAGVPHGEAIRVRVGPEELLPTMDRKNVRTMVNLTGGVGAGLKEAIATFDRAHPGRFVTFTEPSYDRLNEPGFPQWQAEEVGRAKAVGAKGLKVLKALGLYLREQVTEGPLLKVDDERFDPLWEACGSLGLPVAIHVSDPEAFFLPIDRFNERYEELHAHPNWSFHGKDFPSNDELLAARDRLFAKHPKTTFIALHVGHHAENLGGVAAAMDRFPNMYVELGARIGELGRQPRTARQFFETYQDRIVFGTDAVPNGHETPQQVFGDRLYEIYYRFLETEDEYFDYAPADVPPQGRWRIYGLGLPEAILRKVYFENVARLIGL